MTAHSATPDENRAYKWVHGGYQGYSIIGCMLLLEPYHGVVVEFGDVQLTDDGFSYIWRLIDQPEHVTEHLTQDNVLFTKYLERVVNDRLSELNEVDSNGAIEET